jgi:pullulanase
MRKFILDALTYWMNEYKVDGFRFDLMGIHDVDTMNRAAQKLKSLNPGVFLLGEGWDLDTYLEPEKKATLSSAKKMPDYSFFNDAFRDHVKGSIFPGGSSGFINGNQDERIKSQMIHVMIGYSGSHDMFIAPEQSINYTECHDNHTLYDLLAIRHPHENVQIRKKRQQLALVLTLFSRGVPFIHSGQEFFRTKQGAENSYNLPDHINAIDWSLCEANESAVSYFRDLIKIRKEQAIFRYNTAQLLEMNVARGALGVKLQLSLADNKEDPFLWKNVLLLFNQTLKQIRIPLERDTWNIAVEEQRCCNKLIHSDSYLLDPLAFTLLYKE